jgi:hypothetical protein
MPRPLDGAIGESMDLRAYYADFQENYARTRNFWKLERGQLFAEPGDASWEAFDRGDWDEAMNLLEKRRPDLVDYVTGNSAKGVTSRRIRIVSLPPSPYLQWELHLLRIRDEAGAAIRILLDRDIVGLEGSGSLPEIYTMDDNVMYQAIYDDKGVLEHALRYTDKALVARCRDFIADLFLRGEPIGDFFRREIAHLPPARPRRRAIPHDYLKRAGRPQPIRS